MMMISRCCHLLWCATTMGDRVGEHVWLVTLWLVAAMSHPAQPYVES